MAWWTIPAIMTGAGLAGGLKSGKRRKTSDAVTITQEAMQTPEQLSAMKDILGYSKTGKAPSGIGDMITWGEEYGGPLGEFDLSELETGAKGMISDRLKGGMPDIFGMGTDELRKILTTGEYDPYSEKGLYAGFKKKTRREMQEGQDILSRNMAFTGDLFSTAMGKESGLLQERGQDILTNKLAELYQGFQDRKMRAAGMAVTAGGMEEDIMTGRISQAAEMGKIERMIKDEKAKAKYADWFRARNELIGERDKQIQAGRDVMGTNVEWGAKNLTLPATYSSAASPWDRFLDQLIGAGVSGLAAGA